jgi:hypothetical protein
MFLVADPITLTPAGEGEVAERSEGRANSYRVWSTRNM